MIAEVLYASPYSPNLTSSVDVLAFLLIEDDTWVSPKQPVNERFEMNQMMRASKRLVLETWYANHLRSGR